jgi:type II secretory pathway predicted ATPase ExeA
MYESFFDFNDRPFAASPLVENYYPAESIEHARQTLIRIIERAEGPGIAVGQAGVGKSLLCRLISEHFQDNFDVVVLSSARIGTRKALLQSILFELKLAYRELEEGELRLALLDFLQPGNSSPNGMLLIVDEAHTLPLRLLEEIRMITNLVREGKPRARLIMVGGPRLEERFAHPNLDSFNQRLAARCYLENLRREDTFRYIRSQLSAVGGDPDQIFTSDALDAVQRASDGIPRIINQICDHALILACAGGRRQVNDHGVEEAWADLQQLPGPWREEPRPASGSAIVEFGELDDLSSLEIDVQPENESFSVGVDTNEEIDIDEPETVVDISTGMEMPDESDDVSFVRENSDVFEPAWPGSLGTEKFDFDEPETPVDIPTGIEVSDETEEVPIEPENSDVQATSPRSLESLELDFMQVIVGQQFDTGSDTVDQIQVESCEDAHEDLQDPELAGQSEEQESGDSDALQHETVDPFAGDFEEEEVVIDRNTAMAIEAFRDRPMVSSSEGLELAGLLANHQADEPAESEMLNDLGADGGHERTPEIVEELGNTAELDGEPAFEYLTSVSWGQEAYGDVESQIEDSLKELSETNIEQVPDETGHVPEEGEEVTCVVFPNAPQETDDDREIMIITDESGVVIEEADDGSASESPGAIAQIEYQDLFSQLRKA